MKKITISFFVAVSLLAACEGKKEEGLQDKQLVTISKTVLLDKIKGGWAGQTIGVTYGGPTEFKYLGTMIQDYQQIAWPDGYIKHWYETSPGLYDDIYMDLTFVDVFERVGLDAPVDSFAMAYARASYPLWHANQSGRYNILQGITPPQSGHWLNNPHADCIDFQIEADFAGLMSPGMPNTAAAICDKIGHIMNYGDGWYGGVYIASMYSLAFVSPDINFIVKEGLKSIPAESQFYQCMNDVIGWHQQYPDDWKATWFEVQKKWTEDIGCPDGVMSPFNIDAKVNAAYVIIGLLYGNGNFEKTVNIATRCGQDSDCNPSSAAGILGTVIGYKNIPEQWKKNLYEVESMPFKYTRISLNNVYTISNKHAAAIIEKNGGSVKDTSITIIYQSPSPVKMEESFVGLVPKERNRIGKSLTDTLSYTFQGTGIVITGYCTNSWEKITDIVFKIEVNLDGKKDTLSMPFNYLSRRNEIIWKYNLPSASHQLQLRLLNPNKIADVVLNEAIIYGEKLKP